MAFTLLLKRSGVAGHQPTTSQLSVGELSMNSNDGIIYFMQQNSTTLANTIVAITPLTYLSNITASGDITGASVGNAIALTLPNITTAGTYSAVSVNAKGQVIGSTALAFTGDATGSGSGASIALTLASSGVTAGTYGAVTVNAKGIVTSGSNMVFSGDATGTSANAATTLTLATVNTNVGTWGDTTHVASFTVNGKGLVTAVSNTAIAFPVTSVFGRTGAVVLQSSDVTGALGYVPQGNAIVVTGDVTGTSTQNALTLTLANVNGNVGSFGGASTVATFTVNAKGLITAASNVAINVVGALGFTPLNSANASVALTGDATGSATFSGNAVSVATTLAASGVTAGTYTAFAVNSKGLVTSGINMTATGDATGTSSGSVLTLTLASVATAGTFAVTSFNTKGLVTSGSNLVASGDVSGTSSGNAITLTLATVNTAVGSFGGSITVPVITVNGKGLVTNVTTSSINVVSALGYTPVNNAVVGVANGIATLNSSGQLTSSQIPASILGAVVYQGTWNASTNTPTLTSSTGTKGWYYKVSVAGSTTLDGLSQWNVGDTVIFDGSTWDKIDGIASEVLSFNTRTGAITLTSSDVTTALGFTPQGAFVASGDVSGTATQNAITLTLASVGTVGTYSSVTTDAKGRVVSGSNIVVSGDASGTVAGGALTLTLGTVNTNVGTFGAVTVNAKGLVTSAANMVFSGDATGTSSNAATTLTLATVNTNVGSFGGSITVPVITVNGKGLVTAVTTQAISVTSALGYTPLNSANATVTLTGDATGSATFSGNAVSVPVTLASVVTAGTYAAVSVNAKGLVIAGLATYYTGDLSGSTTGANAALTLNTVNTNVGTFTAVIVNAKGLVTNAVNMTFTGDVTGTASNATVAMTLPNVNTNVGTFAGITVNAKGQVTAAANVTTFAGYNLGIGAGPDIIDGGSF